MLNRAYSLIEIKAVDEEKREITGIATTPTPDRAGDVVEPEGAEFELPIPLLWQHNSREPIGEVFEARVLPGKRIEIKARIAKVDEPGKLKDLLDFAWQSIKAKLVKGLSIGFKPLESARIKDTYSYRFIKWLWLELSAVTIPMNGEATIQTVKSIDDSVRAALGKKDVSVVRLDSPAGVSATPIKPKLPEGNMNLAEQIKQFEAKRAALAARLEEIMKKAADEGRTLNEQEGEEHDNTTSELEQVDKHLVRLRTMERSAAANAKAVETNARQTLQGGADNRSPHVLVLPKKLEPGIAFARFVGCVARMKGDFGQALNFAKEVFPNEQPLHDALKVFTRFSGDEAALAAANVKAAVAAGTTSDSAWAGPLVQYNDMASEFLEFLRPQTIVGRIQGLRRVPFNIRMPRQTSGGTAWWVGEGAPKPVTALSFDNVTLRWTKLATIAVITEELARFSSPSAETIIRDTLAKAVIQQMDSDFIDPGNAGTTDVKPASITNGVTPITASGVNEAAVRADILSVFSPFIAANLTPANGVWIMSATTALALSLMVNSLGDPSFPGISMTGGTFNGLPVIVSEAAGLLSSGSPSSPIVILANASDILLADDGQVMIDVSREASLQMNTAPDNPASASTVYRSLWQDNLIGIRAERFVNWVKARAAAVQYIDSVRWGAAS